ncbi:MAG TPA: YecA family protein [Candidatus Cybelea sp.]
MTAPQRDKRVYDIGASDGSGTRVVAVSADSTLLDLHLALLATFDWRGDYGTEERGAYRIEFPQKAQVYTEGRGSRTRLRRLLTVGEHFISTADYPHLVLDGEVLREYEVPSRRHHPKVLDAGGDEYEAKVATWRAQEAVQRELRDAPRRDPFPPEHRNGMFAAIVAGPMLMPSAWLPHVLQTSQYATLGDAQRELARVMEEYNAVAQQLHEAPDAYIEQTRRRLSADESGAALEAWVRGYIYGMALAGEEWRKHFGDEELRKLFTPIGAVMEIYSAPEKRAWLRDAKLRESLGHGCPIAAVQIWRFWRRRLG